MMKIQEVQNYLQDHIHEPVRVSDLARYLHFSTAQVYRDMIRLTGCPPQQYIMDYKLEQAVSMIENTTLSIQEVSANVGFRYESHFYRQFKNIMGITPAEYRQLSSCGNKKSWLGV